MKIAIGNDHVAVDYKNEIIELLESKGHKVVNVGTDSYESTHYPIYGYRVAQMVVKKEVDRGILICGTGVGISLCANKVSGIRAVVCSDVYTAKLSREHNNSNILAFGARVVGIDLAKLITSQWLEAQFEGGRHQARLDMLSSIENKTFTGE